MADISPYAAGRAQRIIDDERKARAQRESDEYARNFQRTQLIEQYLKQGANNAAALKMAYDRVPSLDPKVMLEVDDAYKKSIHPKEFVPITIDGQTYNSNAITGEVKAPYKTPDSFTTTTNTAGVPVQINSSGRQYAVPTVPRAPLDTSRDAMLKAGVISDNTDKNPESPTFKMMTNSSINLLNQYDAAMRNPVAPTAAPVSSAPDQLAPNEVKRLLKDGKAAIFDLNTKQFIRYAD